MVQPRKQAAPFVYNPYPIIEGKVLSSLVRSALPSAVSRGGEALATPPLSPASLSTHRKAWKHRFFLCAFSLPNTPETGRRPSPASVFPTSARNAPHGAARRLTRGQKKTAGFVPAVCAFCIFFYIPSDGLFPDSCCSAIAIYSSSLCCSNPAIISAKGARSPFTA